MQNNDKHIGLIFKFLTKEASENDIMQLNKWIESDSANKKQFESYKNSWEMAQCINDPYIFEINIDNEWNKLADRVGLKYEKDAKVAELKNRSFSLWKVAAAIVIFIIVGGGLFYVFTPKDTTLTAEKSLLETDLPDGSRITLSTNSEIIYSNDYNEDERRLKLEGEAYFEVESDSEKAFIVEANDLFVEVVGTAFYVKSNEKGTVVIVNSGKVMVYKDKNKNDKLLLESGEKIEISETNPELVKAVNEDENYLSWKTKSFKFNNTKLGTAIIYFEKAYNIDIVLENKELENCTISVPFDNQSINQIMNVLKTLYGFEFEINENNVRIYGGQCQ